MVGAGRLARLTGLAETRWRATGPDGEPVEVGATPIRVRVGDAVPLAYRLGSGAFILDDRRSRTVLADDGDVCRVWLDGATYAVRAVGDQLVVGRLLARVVPPAPER